MWLSDVPSRSPGDSSDREPANLGASMLAMFEEDVVICTGRESRLKDTMSRSTV